MGNPTAGSSQAAPADEPSNAAEGNVNTTDHAVPSDAEQAHDSAIGAAPAEIDANAVAAMQAIEGAPGASADLPGDLGLSGDLDLLAALHGLDHVGNIDQALDQLTSSADLFDLPALDFGDAGHHAGGSES